MKEFKPNITKSIDNLNELEEKVNNLQEKEVTIEENGTIDVVPDDDYFALKKVSITTDIKTEPNLQDKEVTITENTTTTITADEGYDGLGEVEVTTNVVSEPDVVYDLSILNTMQSNKYFYNSITEIDLKNDDTLTSGELLFNNMKGLETIKNLNTSNMTSIAVMFANCPNLKNIPIMDLKNVTNINNLIANSTLLTNNSLHNIIKSFLTLTEKYTMSKKLSVLSATSDQNSIMTSFPEWLQLQALGWTVS